MSQLKTAAIMMAVPGGVLSIRNLILRIFEGSARHRDDFTGMQYGGAVKEEKPPSKPPLGIMAKCWQLTFCRDAIRKGCPIYHARTKCWKQRVGCMCEENVIRHAMDSIISKELITKDEPEKKDDGLISFESLVEGKPAAEKTLEIPPRVGPPPSPRNVKIPHNPNLPMRVKIERCKNCVIYNEHQRLKYQFFAPVFTLAIPAAAYFYASQLAGLLTNVFAGIDRLMARLTLAAGGSAPQISALSSFGFANYLILGSLVVILTTMMLRFLEFIIFRLKI